MTIEELRKALENADYTEAVKRLTDYIAAHPDCDAAYTLRGMRHWGNNERALAINDYLAAIRINPDSPAKEALKAVNEILDYRNKDLYNP